MATYSFAVRVAPPPPVSVFNAAGAEAALRRRLAIAEVADATSFARLQDLLDANSAFTSSDRFRCKTLFAILRRSCMAAIERVEEEGALRNTVTNAFKHALLPLTEKLVIFDEDRSLDVVRAATDCVVDELGALKMLLCA